MASSRVELYRRRKESKFANSYQCFPEQPHPHSCLLVFKEFDYSPIKQGSNPTGLRTIFQSAFGERSSGVGLRSSNAIELPFPKTLVDNTNLRINSFERDPFTESIAGKIKAFMDGETGGTTTADIPKLLEGMGASMGAAMGGNSIGQNINDLASKFLGSDVKDVATGAQYLLRKAIPGDISRSIDLVTGQTINPRETLSFEGVNLRTHQLNWDLFPNSKADSQRIKNIVDIIKRKSLPEVTDIDGVPKAFLQYPSVVDIYLIGVNSEHFIKYKTSMITEFAVDYGAAGGVAIMKGGKPNGVNIALNLTELEIETAHDYGEVGNEPYVSNVDLADFDPAVSAGGGGK